jgi:cephalosporin-C deacetylase-like acetyl esterase
MGAITLTSASTACSPHPAADTSTTRSSAGGLDNNWDSNLEHPDKNYNKRVVVGAVRAVDYLASLPQWDGTHLGVTGSSQGGFLRGRGRARQARDLHGGVHDCHVRT